MKKLKKPGKIVSVSVEPDKISRKEALKKVGKYAAFTAAATLIILSPKAAQAVSPNPQPPGW